MLKVLRSGLAATVLAGALSVGMVTHAQAVVPIAPVAPVAVAGAEAAAGATVACFATVVCPVATAVVAVAAIGLYATRDTWMPWFSSRFSDEGETVRPNNSEGGLPFYASVVMDGAYVGPLAHQLSVLYVNSSTASITVTHAYEFQCVTPGGNYTWLVATNSIQGVNGNSSATKVLSCAVGSVPVFFNATAGTLNPTQGRPATFTTWGSEGANDTLPLSTFKATSFCVKPDGTIQNLVVEYSGVTADGFMIPSCEAAGIGNHATGSSVDVLLPGTTAYRPIWTVTAPSTPTYPLCDPTMSTGCALNVWVDGSLCHVGDSRCLDWQSISESRVQCYWGTYVVPDAKCDMLEESYRNPTARISDVNTDGDPTTQTETAPAPTTTAPPGTYPTPVPFPTEVPIPTAVPSPIPTPPPGDPSPTADSGEGCFPTGTAAWNPVEWVLRPVQCALVWAFVPPGGLAPRTESFRTAWDGSAPGLWVATLTDPTEDIAAAWSSGGGGCGGPEWTLSMAAFGGGSYPFRPFDSCREPLASVAPVVKGVGMALVFVIGFRAAANPVLGAMGLPRIPGRRQLWQTEIHS